MTTLLIYSLTKFYLGFTCGEKKKFEGNPPLLLGIHFYYRVCVAQQIINSLYFVFHYLFRGRFILKGLGSSHSNLRIEWKK